MSPVTLRQKIRGEEKTTNEVAEIARTKVRKQIAQLVVDASIGRSEAFAAIRAKAEAMIAERKENSIAWDPVTDVVKIARAQGGAAALRELMSHFEDADKKAALAQKQTAGQ